MANDVISVLTEALDAAMGEAWKAARVREARAWDEETWAARKAALDAIRDALESRAAPGERDPDARVKKGFRLGVEAAARFVRDFPYGPNAKKTAIVAAIEDGIRALAAGGCSCTWTADFVDHGEGRKGPHHRKRCPMFAAADTGGEALDAERCPVPKCHAGMLRDHNGSDSVSCPVCDGVLSPDDYRTLQAAHTPAAPLDRAATTAPDLICGMDGLLASQHDPATMDEDAHGPWRPAPPTTPAPGTTTTNSSNEEG